MGEIKWIKLAVDIFDNRKIKQIEKMPDGNALIVVWLKMLTLAGSTNDNGLVYLTREIPFTDQLLSTQFNMPIAIIQLALATFQKFGMIEVIEDIIHISNWEKYQNIDGMDKIREQGRKRVAEYRERKRLALAECNVTRNATVTASNGAEEEREREEEKDKDKEGKGTARSRFTPPTLDDVQSYCKERNNRVDAERFIDYYASNGWKVGKNQMKDWRAAVRNWERDDKPAQAQRMAKRGLERSEIDDSWAADIMNRPRA